MSAIPHEMPLLTRLEHGEYELHAPIVDHSIQLGLNAVEPSMLRLLDVRIADGLIEVRRQDEEPFNVEWITEQDPVTGAIQKRQQLLRQPMGSICLKCVDLGTHNWAIDSKDVQESGVAVLEEFAYTLVSKLRRKHLKNLPDDSADTE